MRYIDPLALESARQDRGDENRNGGSLVERVAIIGAGLIGRSWSVTFARAGVPVVLYDIDTGALEAAGNWIEAMLPGGGGVRYEDDLARAVAGVDYVQECTAEVLEVKTELFTELDSLTPPEAVLASSTSALLASDFTGGMARPDRALVAHPVNPPHLVPLVELVPSPRTDQRVVAATRAFMERVGQSPIEVKAEIGGFVLNRLQAALINEAVHLVADGVADADDIDRTVRDGLGLRWAFMGPFETMDLNSDQGFAGYSARFREMFAELGRSLVVDAPWPGAACARIDAARRAVLPLDQIGARQAWRDDRVRALRALKDELRAQGA